MAEYIAREVLLAQLRAMESYNVSPMYRRGYDDCVEAILKAPAADVVPVVHGWWISFLDGDHIMPERYYRCSRCGRIESRRQPYCHCGAKMDGGANDD